MNIWEWVRKTDHDLREAGHVRLADLLNELPTATCDGRHDTVEAIAPEALALSRSLDQPWLEVFVRHWLVQSRVLHRHDVTHGLDEVTHLLDFAHTDRAKGCPQSICVVQDLCAAYGVLDGPGYTEERVSVCKEGLSKIDPSWGCFDCISSELAGAHMDAGRFAEAEAFCREQVRLARVSGEDRLFNAELYLVRALAAQGRHEEALAAFQQVEVPRDESERHKSYRIDHSLVLANLGRYAEATAILPDAESIAPTHYLRWALCVQTLCRSGSFENGPKLGAQIQTFARKLTGNGARYEAAHMHVIAAELAEARGASAIARLQIELGRNMIRTLRKPGGLITRLDLIESKLAPPAPLPDNPEEALTSYGGSAERMIQGLERLTPDVAASPGAATALARAFDIAGYPNKAESVYEAVIALGTGDLAATGGLAALWARERKIDRLRSLFQGAAKTLTPMVGWYLATALESDGQLDQAQAVLQQAEAVESDPDGLETLRKRRAELLRNLGRHAEALTILDALVEGRAPGSADWDRMIVATLVGAHEKVRDSAKRLGFEFEGAEGPINQPFAYCVLRTKDAMGRTLRVRAVRTSPVVARVISMTEPQSDQVYGDEWVHEPIDQAPAPPDQPRDHPHVPTFHALERVKRGGYRVYELDGPHPGEDALAELITTLRDKGLAIQVRSDEQYQLVREGADGPTPGVYAWVGTNGLSALELAKTIRDATQAWAEPVTYRRLLQEAGLSEELEAQEVLAESWGLDG